VGGTAGARHFRLVSTRSSLDGHSISLTGSSVSSRAEIHPSPLTSGKDAVIAAGILEAPKHARRSAFPALKRKALAGLVERVTYHDPENGFCVLRVKCAASASWSPSSVLPLRAGEFVQATGSWVTDRIHGLQFKAAFLRAAPPTTLEGIEKYLGSGMIKGIGPVYANKLVQAFGEAVFDTLEESPERLREVAGIGPKRAERIVRGWANQKEIRAIMLFLHRHGVGASRAVRSAPNASPWPSSGRSHTAP
jgi:ATP-dependent exoDNAse (exonuclease V) alpha subunit